MKLHRGIAFCTAPDGTRIAVAPCGTGPVILRAAHWLSPVSYDLESPIWRPSVEALSRHRRYIRYDPRGCGMSERHCADLSLATWVGDLEAVAATMRDGRFALFGASQGVRWPSPVPCATPAACRIRCSSTPMPRAAGRAPAQMRSRWRRKRW